MGSRSKFSKWGRPVGKLGKKARTDGDGNVIEFPHPPKVLTLKSGRRFRNCREGQKG